MIRDNRYFWEREDPDPVEFIGGEIKLYTEAKRFAVSKTYFNLDGSKEYGKTVTINLGANVCDAGLIKVFEDALAILKGEPINDNEDA